MWEFTGASCWSMTEICGTSGHKWSNSPVNFSFNFVEQTWNQALSLDREAVPRNADTTLFPNL